MPPEGYEEYEGEMVDYEEYEGEMPPEGTPEYEALMQHLQ